MTGASSVESQARKAFFKCWVFSANESNVLVLEHINFSARTSVISSGEGNFIQTISTLIEQKQMNEKIQ